MRHAEWAGQFLYHLAIAHLQDSDRAEAESALTQAEGIRGDRYCPLAGKARGLRRHL